MATKTPRLAQVLEPLQKQLEQERDAILAEVKPLQEERQKLLDQIQPLEKQLGEVNEKIFQTEQPRLREVSNELAAIARQLGAVTLTNDGQEAPDGNVGTEGA